MYNIDCHIKYKHAMLLWIGYSTVQTEAQLDTHRCSRSNHDLDNGFGSHNALDWLEKHMSRSNHDLIHNGNCL